MILIHVSYKPINKLLDYTNKQDLTFKPRGLWYSPGKTWINWSRENLSDRSNEGLYYYVVVPYYTTIDEPDTDKVLKITNEEDFDEFTFKYGKIVSQNSYQTLIIDWKVVADNYGGIEIIPYLDSRRGIGYGTLNEIIINKYKKNGFNLTKNSFNLIKDAIVVWYDLFDIASGCIWNPKSIKKFYQIIKRYKIINGIRTKTIGIKKN